MPMPYVDARGARIPALAFGTWQLEGDVCQGAVRDAIEIGYRHIDTARMYGNERAVGKAIRESGVPREEIFLVTKLWHDDLTAPRVAHAVAESLRRLGTDYVDLLLIHWPSRDVSLSETLEAMSAQRDKGSVSFVGVSNFPPTMLKEALDIAEVVCNQVEYHPYLGQEDLLSMSRERDLCLAAYSPLARGRVLKDMVLRQIADRRRVTPAQVVLAWLLKQPRVAAITRSADAGHRRKNFQALDLELDEDEMRRINALGRGERYIDPEFAPDWD